MIRSRPHRLAVFLLLLALVVAPLVVTAGTPTVAGAPGPLESDTGAVDASTGMPIGASGLANDTAPPGAPDGDPARSAIDAIPPDRPVATGGGIELAVVDTSVEDHEALARAAREEGLVVVNVSSAEEVTAAVSEHSNLAAVHVLSHGTVGTVQIGNDTLTRETLDQYGELTGTIESSLAPDGDLLLYGCRVATDGAGRAFLGAVGNATGGDVAASIDATANADQGGDWVLEASAGTVSTAALSAPAFEGVLSVPSDEDFEDDPGAAFTSMTFTLDGVTYSVAGSTTYENEVVSGPSRLPSGYVLMIPNPNVLNPSVVSEVTISQSDGNRFHLDGLDIDVSNDVEIVPEGNSGQAVPLSAASAPHTGVTFDSSFEGVTSVTIRAVGSETYVDLDNLDFSNVPPAVSTNADATVDEGASTTITQSELEASDPEQGPGSLTYTLDTDVSEGQLQNTGVGVQLDQGDTFTQADVDDGSIEYRHDGTEPVGDRFDFTVSDGNGGSATGNFSIVIDQVNDAPTISGDLDLSTDEGAAVTLTSADLEATDPDDSASNLTFTVTSAPTNGSIEVSGSGASTFTEADLDAGTVAYVHDGSGTLPDSFDVELADDDGATSNTEAVTVTDDVAPTLSSSTPSDGSSVHPPGNDLTLTFDEEVQLGSGQILITDEGDGSSTRTLDVTTAAVSASGGTITLDPSSALEPDTAYNVDLDTTAVDDSNGNDFTGSGFSDPGVLNFRTADTDPAFTEGSSTSIEIDEDTTANLTDVLAVSDVSSSDTLTWSVATAPSHGHLSGIDGETTTVVGGNSPHTLDSGPTYTPNANVNGADSFDVEVSDVNPGTTVDTITVSVTINAVNDPPTAADDSDTTDEDTSINRNAANGVIDPNDHDPDLSDVLSVDRVEGAAGNVGAPVTGSDGGRFTIYEDGAYSFDPNGAFEDLTSGQSETTAVTYTLADGNGGTDTATLTVTVTGVNEAPTAVDDTAATDEETTISRGASNGVVQSNDVDVDHASSSLAVALVDGSGTNVGATVTGSDGGRFTVEADGAYSFDPNGAFEDLAIGESETTAVTYTVEDGEGATDTATLSVTVAGVNDAPTAVDDTAMTDEDTSINPNVGSGVIDPNDHDPDLSDVLSVDRVEGAAGNVGAPVTGSNGGRFTLEADGSYGFDPNGAFEDLTSGQSETTAVTYTVADGNGGTDTATLTVTVTGVNDAPTITGCRVLEESGTYVLDGDVTNGSASGCIDVAASDVVIEGQGYTLDGLDESTGRGVAITGSGISNVTVRNLTVTRFDPGVTVEDATGVTLQDVTATGNGDAGVSLDAVADATILDSDLSDNYGQGLWAEPTSGSLAVRHTTISSNGEGGGGYSGLYVGFTGADVAIENNTVYANPGEGIGVYDTPGAVISNNTIPNNGGPGVEVGLGSDDATVVDNTLTSNLRGVRVGSTVPGGFAAADGVTVTANDVSDSEEEGIHVLGSENVVVSDNHVENVGTGTPVPPPFAINVTASDAATVASNTVENNPVGGIQLVDSTAGTVRDNDVSDGDFGLVASNATRATLANNTATSSDDYGIHVLGGSDVLVRNNTATANELGLRITRTTNVTAHGNDVSANGNGTVLDATTDVTLRNTHAANNPEWALHATNGSTVAAATNYTVAGGTSLNFSAHDAGLRADGTPPATPAETVRLGPQFTATNTSDDGWLRLRFDYDGSTLVEGQDESTASVRRYDGNWSDDVGGTNAVDESTDTVTANVTDFGSATPASSFTLLADEVPLANGSPTAFDFGRVHVYDETATTTVNVTNEGLAPLDVVGTGVLGAHASDFSTDPVIGNVTIQPGETVSFPAHFDPASSGTKNATFAVAHTASDDYLNVSVTGVGVAPGVNVTTTTPVEFGRVGVGIPRQTAVTIENNGSAPLDVPAASIDGPNATEFDLVPGGDPTPYLLQPNDSTTFDVEFQPSSGGTETGYLNITTNVSDRPHVNLTLTGEGVNDTQRAPWNLTIDDVTNSVTAGDDVVVGATVENPGTVSGRQTVTLSDLEGTQVDGSSVTLDPGETASLTLVWPTSAGDAGSGAITVATLNSTATQNVTIPTATGADADIEFQEALDETERNSRATSNVTLDANGTVNAQATVDRGDVVWTFLNWTDLDSTASGTSESWSGISGHRYRLTYEATAQRSAATAGGNRVAASGFVQGPSGSHGQLATTVYTRSPSFGDVPNQSVGVTFRSQQNRSAATTPAVPNVGHGVMLPTGVTFSGVPPAISPSVSGLPSVLGPERNGSVAIGVVVQDDASEGSHTFQATVRDSLGHTETVDVTVTVEKEPIAAADRYTVTENGSLSVPAPGVLQNDTRGDRSGLSVTATVDEPDHGIVTVYENGSFDYAPDPGFTGEDSFTYEVTDADGDTDRASVTVAVTEATGSAEFRVDISDITSPVTVGDDLVVTYAVENAGSVAGTQDVAFTAGTTRASSEITLGPGVSTTGTFRHTAEPGDVPRLDVTVATQNDTATRTVPIERDETNSPPGASDDSYETVSASTLTVGTPGVLDNDGDPDGDALSASLETDVSHGYLTLLADGSFEYVPEDGFVGQDSFAYRVTDGNAGSDTATVTIDVAEATPETADFRVNITEVNESVASGDEIVVEYTVRNAGSAPGSQDVSFTVRSAQVGVDPAVSLDAGASTTGRFTYTTDASDAPAVDLTVTSQNDTETRTVAVTEADRNDPPAAAADAYSVAENGTLSVDAPGVLANDDDPNGDPLSAAVVDGPADGSLDLRGNGSFTYAPTPGFTGVDSFSYEASDGNGGADDAAVTITVTEQPTPSPSFEVQITGTNAPVTEGETLSVAVRVENAGAAAGTQSITLESIDGTAVDARSIALDAGGETTLTLEWPTTDGDAGAGEVAVRTANDTAVRSVTVEDADDGTSDGDGDDGEPEEGDGDEPDQGDGGEAGPSPEDPEDPEDGGESPGSIDDPSQPDPASFAVDLGAVAERVDVGTELVVPYTVENVGGQTGTTAVRLLADGDVVATRSYGLDAGEAVTDEVALTPGPEAMPTLEVAVVGDGDRDADVVAVDGEARPVIEAVAVPEQAGTGETVSAVVDLRNDGAVAYHGTVRFVLGDAATERSIDLPPGEAATVALETDARSPGENDWRIEAADATEGGTLTVRSGLTYSHEVERSEGTVTVAVTVENPDPADATENVTVSVGEETRSRTIAVPAGERVTERFTVEAGALGAGEKSVEVRTDDGSVATGEVTVPADEDGVDGGSGDDLPMPVVAGVVVALVAVFGAGGYWWWD